MTPRERAEGAVLVRQQGPRVVDVQSDTHIVLMRSYSVPDAEVRAGWLRDMVERAIIADRAERDAGEAERVREAVEEALADQASGVAFECPIRGVLCTEHGYVHGQEAEELRAGVERILKDEDATVETLRHDLNRLLDSVDARDSLAWLGATESATSPAPVASADGLDDPLLDPARMSDEQVDAVLRGVGIDPAALGERGAAFVKVVRAERAVVEAAEAYASAALALRAARFASDERGATIGDAQDCADLTFNTLRDALAAARKGGG